LLVIGFRSQATEEKEFVSRNLGMGISRFRWIILFNTSNTFLRHLSAGGGFDIPLGLSASQAAVLRAFGHDFSVIRFS